MLYVRLFGRLSIEQGGRTLDGLDARKVQELFCYLLLRRDHHHAHETLSSVFWGDLSTAQSKKALRQTLWHLQTVLEGPLEPAPDSVLCVEPEWVQLNPRADLWLDVAAFERAFSLAQGIPGEALNEETARALQDAVHLYRGDLLEGWYQEWCVYERERLKYLYLTMLDRLMGYCEARHTYEAGISYGMQILRYDRARERTHRRLMVLYYRAGDRVAALRQYERCLAVLNEELSARPAKSTVTLYQQILADQFDDASDAVPHVHFAPSATTSAFAKALAHLKQFSAQLDVLQRQVLQDIQALETLDDPQEPADARH